MARKAILDTYYTFTPSTKTIVIPRAVPRERLILITNVTTNQVIYNFSDNSLTATSYSIATDVVGNTSTTIVLNYSTGSMASTDKLQIVIDEYDEKFSPSDVYTDPVNKFRTSQPQALIDTDFEYGQQATKWESLGMINNRPFSYWIPSVPNLPVLGITGANVSTTAGSRTVTYTIGTITAVGGTNSVANTQLTIASISAGTLAPGMQISGTGITSPGTYIVGQLISTATNDAPGGAGVYLLNQSATVPNSTTITGLAPAVGTPIYVTDTAWAAADGLYMVEAQANTTSFTYTARVPATSTASIANATMANATLTVCQSFTGAGIPLGTSANISYTANTVTVQTNVPHGLTIGNEVYIIGTTGNTIFNGAKTVMTVANSTVFKYVVNTSPTGTLVASSASLYVRPVGTNFHRAFDGGVSVGVNNTSHNQQMIRQTRRYFRYQSGKGIQFSTGTALRPNINVDQISASGTTITVATRDQHNINPGSIVTIAGCNETGYNGSFTVNNVLDAYRFQYTATVAPSLTPATGNMYVSIVTWYGAQNRIGLFDDQNGLFFEWDGQTLYAVKRSSTYQIAGLSTVTNGSSTVTGITFNGVTPLYSKQLSPGDMIVIKGSRYRVLSIESDTSMTIQPPYRGSSLISPHGAAVTRITEQRIPQSQWNIDRCDGTGPSGYNLDLSRMQMFYIDYSWYGAGFVRWGFRSTDGSIIYCHRIWNNNINYEAYMRSGNLPARYETSTFAKTAYVALPDSGTTYATSDVTFNVSDLTGWPTGNTSNPATAWIRKDGVSEFINYTGTSQAAVSVSNVQSGNTTVVVTSNTGIAIGQYVMGTGVQINSVVNSVTGNNVVLSLPATATAIGTSLRFAPRITGVTRGQAGSLALAATGTSSSTTLTCATNAIQVGMFVTGTNIPDNTTVYSIGTGTIQINQLPSGTVTTINVVPMGNPSATTGTLSISNTAPTTIESVAPLFASAISHWGSSVIMDGRYDDDKSFVFTKGMGTQVAIANGINTAIMSFRISPSVHNGIGGANIGAREIVNRMQMVLRQLDLLANGTFLITLVLNGQTNSSTPTWQLVGGSSLAQYVIHSAGTLLSGGETVYGTFLNNSGGTNYTSTSVDLNLVRDLGNGILGGGTSTPNTGIYPDGPDVVTIMARNVGAASANVFARLSWTEAQA
jgi:hypothetical protein